MLFKMKELELEFQTNANACGLHTFRQIKRGITLDGKPIYIYERIHAEGKKQGQVFGYEVIIPSVKKAGTYPLPGGKTITYTEDFQEYAGASKFGKSAWSYPSNLLKAAEKKFKFEMEKGEKSEPLMVGAVAIANSLSPNPSKTKGRPRVDRPLLTIPEGEFSTTELAELNKVDYPVAALFLKDNEAAGKVMRTRTERRASRGKETQLYSKV